MARVACHELLELVHSLRQEQLFVSAEKRKIHQLNDEVRSEAKACSALVDQASYCIVYIDRNRRRSDLCRRVSSFVCNPCFVCRFATGDSVSRCVLGSIPDNSTWYH